MQMTYDLGAPAFLTAPGPVLADMRAAGPLVWAKLPLIGRLRITTTDAAARALLKDPRLVRQPETAGGRPLSRMFWWMPRSMRPLLSNLVVRDEPDHTRLRRLVDRAFAKTAMDDLTPEIARIADDLLDRIDPGTATDMISAYARPLPFAVICALLGIPGERRADMARAIAPISAVRSSLSALSGLLRLRRSMGLIREEIAAARAGDRGGLLAALAETAEDGDRLSEDEFLAMVFTLFVAGHETTVHLIGNALVALAVDPGLRKHLTADPARLPLAVEEFMRFFSPVIITKLHVAREDFEFQGVGLRRGDRLSACLLAANHDPARVRDPGVLRPDRRPNAHLGFGFGPHVCLGMQLARTEAATALARLLRRYPDVTLSGPPPQWLRRTGIRGPKSVVLSLAGP